MLKLHSLENTELSSYCLNILEKHGITLIREFVAEKSEKLIKVLNLNYDQVKKIKEEFKRVYGPKHYTEEHLRNYVLSKKIYGTYIQSLDEMLTPLESFGNFSFWEICGPAGVGKTQLAFTLILNFVINQVTPAMYIDTKLDFSASRIKNMLEARKTETDLHAGIMSFINVERVLTAQGVVEMLEEFHKQLLLENEDVTKIKMIVIDSLPAVWFLLKADSNRLAGKWLLSRLSQIINVLVRQHFIAVICVNLSLLPSSENDEKKLTVNSTAYNENDISDLIDNDDKELTDDVNNASSLAGTYRPVLGQFWLSKPHLRLSLEHPDPEDINYKEDSSLRVIKIINTRFSPSDRSCLARLQPEGFV